VALPALKLILTPLLMGRASLGATLWTHGTLAHLRNRLLRGRERLVISHYAIPGHAMEAMAPLVAALAGR